jgi:hypothetical protein
VFKPLLHETPIFWTESGGGRWIKLSDAFFLPEDLSLSVTNRSEVRAVKQFLVSVGIAIVADLPSKFVQAFIRFGEKKKFQVQSDIPYYADLLSSWKRIRK